MYNDSWPLTFVQWNDPIGLRYVMHSCLRPRRERSDEHGNGSESAPGTGEIIGIEVRVNGWYGCVGVRMGKILDKSVFTGLAWFGDE